jgi:superfamily II DNA or RNA helicase
VNRRAANTPARSQALRTLREFADRKAAEGLPRVAASHLEVQADRVAELVQRLGAPGATVLGDPVGTGKTVVALCAFTVLRNHGVDYGLVIAPNDTVRRRWAEAARQLDLPCALTGHGDVWSKGRLVITTVADMRTYARTSPRPADTVLIVDEAHRGLQSESTASYEYLATAASGTRTLLVTATPFQLRPSGLATMLGLPHHKEGLATTSAQVALTAHGEAITALLTAWHETQDHTDPAVFEAIERLRRSLAAVGPVLHRHFTSPYPQGKARVPDPPRPAKHLVTPSHDWLVGYHTARLVPELVETGKGDMFHRRLVSSTEAFQLGKAGRALLNDPLHRTLGEELLTRLKPGAGHPKVRATVDWAAQRHREGRHVLVFCVYRETQAALADALRLQLNPADVESPDSPPRPSVRDRFRSPTARPLVLVVRDNLSESIDLDGGRPCVAHHDLAWSPARLVQRYGRVVRVSSGFQPIEPADVLVPVLDVATDHRLFDTVVNRRDLATLMLPDDDAYATEHGGDTAWSLPAAILEQLRPTP